MEKKEETKNMSKEDRVLPLNSISSLKYMKLDRIHETKTNHGKIIHYEKCTAR